MKLIFHQHFYCQLSLYVISHHHDLKKKKSLQQLSFKLAVRKHHCDAILLSLVAGVLGGSLPILSFLESSLVGEVETQVGLSSLSFLANIQSLILPKEMPSAPCIFYSFFLLCQPFFVFSSFSYPFALRAHLLLYLADFGSLDTSFVPEHPSLCAPLGMTLFMCLCDTFMNDVAITEVQNTQCALFNFHSTFRFRASCPNQSIYNLLLSVLDAYMLKRGTVH